MSIVCNGPTSKIMGSMLCLTSLVCLRCKGMVLSDSAPESHSKLFKIICCLLVSGLSPSRPMLVDSSSETG